MFFVQIEGPDCSFKDSVIGHMRHMFNEREDINFKTITSINYMDESSFFIRQHLNGKYDMKNWIANCLCYAMDRYNTTQTDVFKKAMKDDNTIFITNRWTASNVVYQLDNKFSRLDKLIEMEHEDLKIPKPDLSITMKQDIDLARSLIAGRDQSDIIEGNDAWLKKAFDIYYSSNSVYARYVKNCCKYKETVKVFEGACTRTLPDISKEVFGIIIKYFEIWKGEKENEKK